MEGVLNKKLEEKMSRSIVNIYTILSYFFFTNGDNLDDVYFGILSMNVKSNFLISYPTFSPLFAKPNPVVGYFNIVI